MKRVFAILAAGLALWACTKEAPVAEKATQPLKFNITVTRTDTPDTKAVKTGWEDGDVVYVFFSEAEAPKYLEMKYDAETDSWTGTQKDGTGEETFDLTAGTMTAVFLPFGSDAEVGADDDGNYVFNKVDYCYYLKTEKTVYKVRDGVVYGNLEMQLPDGFVQFFMDAPTLSAEAAATFNLWESHLAPAGVESVAADGTVKAKARPNGCVMPAYFYDNGTEKGLHFSGILDGEVRGVATTYVFHLNVGATNTPFAVSYAVSGTKTLYTETSRALKLPDSDSDSWEEEEHAAVDLGVDVKWATMNVGAANPLEKGDYFAWGETEPYYSNLDPLTWKDGKADGYDWPSYFDRYYNIYALDKKTVLEPANDAATANWGESWRIPTEAEWNYLHDKVNFEWTWDDTQKGHIVTSKIPGFEGRQIFLPAAGNCEKTTFQETGSRGHYWSSSLVLNLSESSYAKVNINGKSATWLSGSRCYGNSVRPVCN